MGRRRRLEAQDEVEHRLLADIDALGSDGREQAAAVLNVSRDVIDRMWSASTSRPRREMRLSEARKLANWLSYDLELRPSKERAS